MKEKAQKREERECILNQDIGKISLALKSSFEKYRAQILKEWKLMAYLEATWNLVSSLSKYCFINLLSYI